MDKTSKEYKRAYSDANKKYGEKSSIYRSAYIVKRYKELNGKFDEKKKPSIEKGLKRWFSGEQWIRVVPYLERGEILPCGGGGDRVHACRPLKRQNKSTPITIPELLKIHSKQDILKAAKNKEKFPEKRLLWKSLKLN